MGTMTLGRSDAVEASTLGDVGLLDPKSVEQGADPVIKSELDLVNVDEDGTETELDLSEGVVAKMSASIESLERAGSIDQFSVESVRGVFPTSVFLETVAYTESRSKIHYEQTLERMKNARDSLVK